MTQTIWFVEALQPNVFHLCHLNSLNSLKSASRVLPKILNEWIWVFLLLILYCSGIYSFKFFWGIRWPFFIAGIGYFSAWKFPFMDISVFRTNSLEMGCTIWNVFECFARIAKNVDLRFHDFCVHVWIMGLVDSRPRRVFAVLYWTKIAKISDSLNLTHKKIPFLDTIYKNWAFAWPNLLKVYLSLDTGYLCLD